ncbi:hypothetical protein [Actinoplanes aureus]|uniref:Uncharacterized protein n=1 Tax=Actinoplanes aureus TaxID=2792083 RepID=A0A931CLP4_9ACTN|nr:hypothetical protein [Actinoplanes aureus]MBG0569316.1 hypothetical protein [Actinoplanes aureus]
MIATPAGLSVPAIQHECEVDTIGNGVRSIPLSDPGAWRYTVIQPLENSTLTGRAVAETLRLSEADLWVDLWAASAPDGAGAGSHAIGGHPGRCLQFFGRGREHLPEVPALDEVAKLIELRANFDDSSFPEIARLVAQFVELDVLPDYSSAKNMSYFSLIEGALSHAPEPSDPFDSITRQLKRNLSLLEHRLPNPESFGLGKFSKSTGLP